MGRFNSHDGYTLVGVLLTIVIISVVGLSLVTIAFASLNVSSGERDDQSAFYIAEAGLTYVMSEIEEKAYEIYEKTDTEELFFDKFDKYIIDNVSEAYYDFELIFQKQPKAEIVTDGEIGEYTVTSTGKIGKKKRTVQSSFNLEWTAKGGLQLPELAIFTQGDMEIHQHATFKTDDYIGTVSGSIPNKFQNIAKVVEAHKFPGDFEFQLPPVNFTYVSGNKTIQDESLTEFHTYENLILKDKVTIYTGDTDKVIVTKNLNLDKGIVTIEGQGKLTIFVQSLSRNGNGNILNKDGDPNKLDVMYYPENKEIKLDPNLEIIGNIFTNATEFSIQTGSTKVTGLIFAPNAKVILDSRLIGSVVASTVEIKSNSNIEYKPYGVEEGDVERPEEGGSSLTFTKSPITEQ